MTGSRAVWYRLGVLLVFAVLVLGQSVLPAGHLASEETKAEDSGRSCETSDARHVDKDGCPHEHDGEHDPSTCGICKQLMLAKSLVVGSTNDEYIVEFVEVPDGRVIGLVHRARPELANARPRGPPAADL
ncbi:MAG: hypothetical protein ACOYN0_02880 [Phycisphaerales bacterium]